MFSSITPKNASKKNDPIKHVVYLMMENQSFDRKLGDITKIKPEAEGINAQNAHFNLDNNGNKIYQKETTSLQMSLDPLHEVPDVHQQLSNQNGGFVQNFIAHYPKSSAEDHQAVMGYYPYGFLPSLHALAAEYTVCDHWFASVPGPTWTNRFFALSGTSMGRVEMLDTAKDFKHVPELFFQTQANIFDRLDEKHISWRCYSGDFPISLVLTHNRELHNLMNYRNMDQFYEDAKGPADKFPQFTFIEPKYLDKNQNDDHPPHNTMKAEKLIADVYNALRANNDLWMNILFVLVYDEHGGFYDHVVPPTATAPDDHREEGFDFKQLGFRVPAILISPWAKKSLEQTVFDHTSFLKYLIEKWDLKELGTRTKEANNISIALDLDGEPRKDCLPFITVPGEKLISPDPHLEEHSDNANHDAIHAFADYLNQIDKHTYIPDLPLLGNLAWLKDKFGEMLESLGLTKLGHWLREEVDDYRKKRVDHTLKIVGNKLTMFQPKKTVQEDSSIKESIKADVVMSSKLT